MKSIRSILHILLGVTLICSCNEATELAHITPNVSLIKYKDIVKIDSLYTYPGDSLYQNWINQYNKNLERQKHQDHFHRKMMHFSINNIL